MNPVSSVRAVRTGVSSEVPDIQIEKVAKGLNLEIATGPFTAALTVTGAASSLGDAIRLTYDGQQIRVPGRSFGEGAKSALSVGTALQSLLAGATGALVTGSGDVNKYVISVIHI